MVYGPFQPTQRDFVKHVLVLFVIILALIPVVKAEDKSWYEIDGIRIRPAGFTMDKLTFYIPWKIEKRINPYFSSPPFKGAITGKEQQGDLFRFTLELPETLMTSWSFRGGLFEFELPKELKDLGPRKSVDNEDNLEVFLEDNFKTHNSKIRTSLYNDFFNDSDKAFADANSNWAMSADVKSSRIFLGYTWGFFIPIGENHRFLKFGAGLGVYYIDLSFKLNLCSHFLETKKQMSGIYRIGECIGKTEIDSYSGKELGSASSGGATFWERRTKDSIWRLFSQSEGVALGSNDKGFIRAKLKNHSKNLALWMSSMTVEIVSYTYRF